MVLASCKGGETSSSRPEVAPPVAETGEAGGPVEVTSVDVAAVELPPAVQRGAVALAWRDREGTNVVVTQSDSPEPRRVGTELKPVEHRVEASHWRRSSSGTWQKIWSFEDSATCSFADAGFMARDWMIDDADGDSVGEARLFLTLGCTEPPPRTVVDSLIVTEAGDQWVLRKPEGGELDDSGFSGSSPELRAAAESLWKKVRGE